MEEDPMKTQEKTDQCGACGHERRDHEGCCLMREDGMMRLIPCECDAFVEPLSVADCTCYHSCMDDPKTGCSLSGDFHTHQGEPCPVHPEAPETP